MEVFIYRYVGVVSQIFFAWVVGKIWLESSSSFGCLNKMLDYDLNIFFGRYSISLLEIEPCVPGSLVLTYVRRME